MIQNTKDQYGLVAQGLHWLTALLILTLIPLGVYMHELPQANQAQIDDKIWLYSLHKTLGMTAFCVAIVRILWALRSTKPGLLNPEHKLEAMAAEIAHWLLYISMIAMPVTGWLHHAALDGFAPIWGPFPQEAGFIPKDADVAHLFGTLHVAFAFLMAGTILAHVGGAMKHFVIDKDQTLQRMIPFAHKVVESLPALPHAKSPLVVAVGIYVAVVAGVYIVEIPSHDHAHDHAQGGDVGETVAASAAAVSQSGWVVDYAKSRLAVSVTQMGSPVDGAFSSWNAAISFDESAPADATIKAEIAIGSLSLGAVSKDALGPDYLDAANFQTAIYTSTGFTNLGGNQWQTDGVLSLHGVEQPVTLTFTLDITNDRAFVKASADLDRTLFDIGPGDEGSVLKSVKVVIDLEADRAS